MAGYLPAKFRLRFLEPVELDPSTEDAAAIQAAAEGVRSRIQDNLFEMVRARDSIWFG